MTNTSLLPLSRSGRGSWPFERCYQMLGYTFRVRSDQPELGGVVDSLLSRFRVDDSSPGPTYALVREGNGSAPFYVYYEDDCVQRGPSAAKALDYLLWHVNSEGVKGIQSFIALHAAAASWKGQGVLLPAPPDSGKTTTVAGLIRAGFAYLTDEASLIHPRSGMLHPYARPLWMSSLSVDVVAGLRDELTPRFAAFMNTHNHVRAEDLRPGSVGRACRVRWIVAPHYTGRGQTALEPMSRAEALVLLAENSFNFKRFGSAGLSVLRDVVSESDCYRLRIADLESAVRAVSHLVGAPARTSRRAAEPHLVRHLRSANGSKRRKNTVNEGWPASASPVRLSMGPQLGDV